MPDELDLAPIEARYAASHLVGYLPDIGALLAEIRRLRALVAEEREHKDNYMCTTEQAREVADMVLTWLDDRPDSLYLDRTAFCRWNTATESWEPISVSRDALLAEFLEWGQQE